MKTHLSSALLLLLVTSNPALRAQNVGAWLETDQYGNQVVRSVNNNNQGRSNAGVGTPVQIDQYGNELRLIDGQWRIVGKSQNGGQRSQRVGAWLETDQYGNQIVRSVQDNNYQNQLNTGVGVPVRFDQYGNKQQFINGQWQFAGQSQKGNVHETRRVGAWLETDQYGNQVVRTIHDGQGQANAGVGTATRIDEFGNEQQFINGQWQIFNHSGNRDNHNHNQGQWSMQWKVDSQGRYFERYGQGPWVQKQRP